MQFDTTYKEEIFDFLKDGQSMSHAEIVRALVISRNLSRSETVSLPSIVMKKLNKLVEKEFLTRGLNTNKGGKTYRLHKNIIDKYDNINEISRGRTAIGNLR